MRKKTEGSKFASSKSHLLSRQAVEVLGDGVNSGLQVVVLVDFVQPHLHLTPGHVVLAVQGLLQSIVLWEQMVVCVCVGGGGSQSVKALLQVTLQCHYTRKDFSFQQLASNKRLPFPSPAACKSARV